MRIDRRFGIVLAVALLGVAAASVPAARLVFG
jgi:hypothetical protein